MTFNTKNFSKATFKAQITRKQNQFNRFSKRFNASRNPVEKSFLKTEANYIVEDLKACAKQWTSCGFGPCAWITRNFTMTSFNNNTPTTRKTTRKFGTKSTRKFGSKTTSRKRNAKRSYARRTNKTRSNARRTNKTKSYARRSSARKSSARRSYVAW